MGIFDDIFDDDDFILKDDKEKVKSDGAIPSKSDSWDSDMWSTGKKSDIWNTAEEPWISNSEKDNTKKFSLDDYFN